MALTTPSAASTAVGCVVISSVIAPLTTLRLSVFHALNTVSTKSALPRRASAMISIARSWVPMGVSRGSKGRSSSRPSGLAIVSMPSGIG